LQCRHFNGSDSHRRGLVVLPAAGFCFRGGVVVFFFRQARQPVSAEEHSRSQGVENSLIISLDIWGFYLISRFN